MIKKPELLAPAGSVEGLQTALRFGADAVYVGGPMLQLRADAAAFTMEELAGAVSMTHSRGKKLYVTVNSFVRTGELKQLAGYARELCALGADAVIVSDIGAMCTIREAAPELELHVSTQANCLNSAAARHYYELGAKRIVPAREMTLEEIRILRAEIPEDMEIECFIHGAMCMAYSGRCLISAYMNGRSGNRGDCSQPCRYRYVLSEAGKDGEYYPVGEDERGTTILSSRDLNAMPFLDELTAAGVSSLKIEGRMKSSYYTATVVNAYRRRLDGTASPEECERELDCASHREYFSGFYFGRALTAKAEALGYRSDCTFIALVLGEAEGGYLIEQRNNFSTGDRLEILSPNSLGLDFEVGEMTTEEGETVTYAPHPQQKLIIKCPHKLEAGDILRRRMK